MSENTFWFVSNSGSSRTRRSPLLAFEKLENRQLMAGDILPNNEVFKGSSQFEQSANGEYTLEYLTVSDTLEAVIVISNSDYQDLLVNNSVNQAPPPNDERAPSLTSQVDVVPASNPLNTIANSFSEDRPLEKPPNREPVLIPSVTLDREVSKAAQPEVDRPSRLDETILASILIPLDRSNTDERIVPTKFQSMESSVRDSSVRGSELLGVADNPSKKNDLNFEASPKAPEQTTARWSSFSEEWMQGERFNDTDHLRANRTPERKSQSSEYSYPTKTGSTQAVDQLLSRLSPKANAFKNEAREFNWDVRYQRQPLSQISFETPDGFNVVAVEQLCLHDDSNILLEGGLPKGTAHSLESSTAFGRTPMSLWNSTALNSVSVASNPRRVPTTTNPSDELSSESQNDLAISSVLHWAGIPNTILNLVLVSLLVFALGNRGPFQFVRVIHAASAFSRKLSPEAQWVRSLTILQLIRRTLRGVMEPLNSDRRPPLTISRWISVRQKSRPWYR